MNPELSTTQDGKANRIKRAASVARQVLASMGAGFEAANQARELGDGVDRATALRVPDTVPEDLV